MSTPRPHTSVTGRVRPPTAPASATMKLPLRPTGTPSTSRRPLSSSMSSRAQLVSASSNFMNQVLKGEMKLPQNEADTRETPERLTVAPIDPTLMKLKPQRSDTVTLWPSSDTTPVHFRPSSTNNGRGSQPSTRPSSTSAHQPRDSKPSALKPVPAPPSQHRTHNDQLLSILNPFLESKSQVDADKALEVCGRVLASILSKSGLAASRRDARRPVSDTTDEAPSSAPPSVGHGDSIAMPLPMFVEHFGALLRSAQHEEVRRVSEGVGPAAVEEAIPKHEMVLEVLRSEEAKAWENVRMRRRQLQEVQRTVGLATGFHMHAAQGEGNEIPLELDSDTSDSSPQPEEDGVPAEATRNKPQRYETIRGAATGNLKSVPVFKQRRQDAIDVKRMAKLDAARKKHEDEDAVKFRQRELAAKDAVYKGMLELHAQVVERRKRANRMDRLRRRVRRGIVAAGAQFADTTERSDDATISIPATVDLSTFPIGASLPELRGRDSHDPELSHPHAMGSSDYCGDEVRLPPFLVEYYRNDTSTTHRLHVGDINKVLLEAGSSALLRDTDPYLNDVQDHSGDGASISDREAVLGDRSQPLLTRSGQGPRGARGRAIVLSAEAAAATVVGEPYVPGVVDRDATGRVAGGGMPQDHSSMHDLNVEGLMTGRRMLGDFGGVGNSVARSLRTQWKDVVTDGTLAHFLYNNAPPVPTEGSEAERFAWQPTPDDFLVDSATHERTPQDVADPFLRLQRMVARCKAEGSKIQRLQRQYDVLFGRYEREKRSLLEHNRQYAELIELRSFERHLLSEISRITVRLNQAIDTQKGARAHAAKECQVALDEGMERLGTLKQLLSEVDTARDHKQSILNRIEEEVSRQQRLEAELASAQLKAAVAGQRATMREERLRKSINVSYATWLKDDAHRRYEKSDTLRTQASLAATRRRKLSAAEVDSTTHVVDLDPRSRDLCHLPTVAPVRFPALSPSPLSLYFGSHSHFATSYVRLVSRLLLAGLSGSAVGIPYGALLRATLGLRGSGYAVSTAAGVSAISPALLHFPNADEGFLLGSATTTSAGATGQEDLLGLLTMIEGIGRGGVCGLAALPMEVPPINTPLPMAGALASLRSRHRKRVGLTPVSGKVSSRSVPRSSRAGVSASALADVAAGYAYWAAIMQSSASPPAVLFPLAIHACARVAPYAAYLLGPQHIVGTSTLPSSSTLPRLPVARADTFRPPLHPVSHWSHVLAVSAALREASAEFHLSKIDTDRLSAPRPTPPTWQELRPLLVASNLLDGVTEEEGSVGSALVNQLCQSVLSSSPPTMVLPVSTDGSTSPHEVVEHMFVALRKVMVQSSAGPSWASEKDEDEEGWDEETALVGGTFNHSLPPPAASSTGSKPGGADSALEGQVFYHTITVIVPKDGATPADIATLYNIPLSSIVQGFGMPPPTAPIKESDANALLRAVCGTADSVLQRAVPETVLAFEHVAHWMAGVLSPFVEGGVGAGSRRSRYSSAKGGLMGRGSLRSKSTIHDDAASAHPYFPFTLRSHRVDSYLRRLLTGAHGSDSVIPVFEPKIDCKEFLSVCGISVVEDEQVGVPGGGAANDPTFHRKSLLWEWQRQHIALALLLWLRNEEQRCAIIGPPSHQGVPSAGFSYSISLMVGKRAFHNPGATNLLASRRVGPTLTPDIQGMNPSCVASTSLQIHSLRQVLQGSVAATVTDTFNALATAALLPKLGSLVLQPRGNSAGGATPQVSAARLRMAEQLRKWMALRADASKGTASVVDAVGCPSDAHWQALIGGLAGGSAALTVSNSGSAATIRNARAAFVGEPFHITRSQRRVEIDHVPLPPALLVCAAQELSQQLLLACPSLVMGNDKPDGSLPVVGEGYTSPALSTASGEVVATLPHPATVPIFSTQPRTLTAVDVAGMYPLSVAPTIGMPMLSGGGPSRQRASSAGVGGGDSTLGSYLGSVAAYANSKTIPYVGIHTVFGDTVLCGTGCVDSGADVPDLFTHGGGFTALPTASGVAGGESLVNPTKSWLPSESSPSSPRRPPSSDASPRVNRVVKRQLAHLWGEHPDSQFIPTGTPFIPMSLFGAEQLHRVHERSFQILVRSLELQPPTTSLPLLTLHRRLEAARCIPAAPGFDDPSRAFAASILALVEHVEACLVGGMPNLSGCEASLVVGCLQDAHTLSVEEEAADLLSLWDDVLAHESVGKVEGFVPKSVGELSNHIQNLAQRQHLRIITTPKTLAGAAQSASGCGDGGGDYVLGSLLLTKLKPWLPLVPVGETRVPDDTIRAAFQVGFRLHRLWKGVCMAGGVEAAGRSCSATSQDTASAMQWMSLAAGTGNSKRDAPLISIRKGAGPLEGLVLASPVAFLSADLAQLEVPDALVKMARRASQKQARGGAKGAANRVNKESPWHLLGNMRPTHQQGALPSNRLRGACLQPLRQIVRNVQAASTKKSGVDGTLSVKMPNDTHEATWYRVLSGFIPHLLEDSHSWSRHVDRQAQELAVRILRGGRDRELPSPSGRRRSSSANSRRRSSGEGGILSRRSSASSGRRRRSSSVKGRRSNSTGRGKQRRRSSNNVTQEEHEDPVAAEERAKVEGLFGPLSQWESVDSLNRIPYPLVSSLRLANAVQTGLRTAEAVGRAGAEQRIQRRLARRVLAARLPAAHSAHRCRDVDDLARRQTQLASLVASRGTPLSRAASSVHSVPPRVSTPPASITLTGDGELNAQRRGPHSSTAKGPSPPPPRLLPAYTVAPAVSYRRRVRALVRASTVVNPSQQHLLFERAALSSTIEEERRHIELCRTQAVQLPSPRRRTTALSRSGSPSGASSPQPLEQLATMTHRGLVLVEITGFDPSAAPRKTAPPTTSAGSPLHSLLRALVAKPVQVVTSGSGTPPSGAAQTPQLVVDRSGSSASISPKAASAENLLLLPPTIQLPRDSLLPSADVSETESLSGTPRANPTDPPLAGKRKARPEADSMHILFAIDKASAPAPLSRGCGALRYMPPTSPKDALQRVVFRVLGSRTIPLALVEEAAIRLAAVASEPLSTSTSDSAHFKQMVRDLFAVNPTSVGAAIPSLQPLPSSVASLRTSLTMASTTIRVALTGVSHGVSESARGEAAGERTGLGLSLSQARRTLDALRAYSGGLRGPLRELLLSCAHSVWCGMGRAYHAAVLLHKGAMPYHLLCTQPPHTQPSTPPPATKKVPPYPPASAVAAILGTENAARRALRVNALAQTISSMSEQQDALLGFLLDTIVSEGLREINRKECLKRVSWVEEGCARMTQLNGGGHLPELTTALAFIRCGFNSTSGSTILRGLRSAGGTTTEAVANRWLVHSPPIVAGFDINPSVTTSATEQLGTELAGPPTLFVPSSRSPGRTFIRKSRLLALLSNGPSSPDGTATTPIFSLDDVYVRFAAKTNGASHPPTSEQQVDPLRPPKPLWSRVATVNGAPSNKLSPSMGSSSWGSSYQRKRIGLTVSAPGSPRHTTAASTHASGACLTDLLPGRAANDGISATRIRGGATGVRDQLPEDIRYMLAERTRLRSALLSSAPSNGPSPQSHSAVEGILCSTVTQLSPVGELTVHTPPLFDATATDFIDMLSGYVQLRAVVDNREVIGGLLRQRKARKARKRPANKSADPSSGDPSVEALPWWAAEKAGSPISGPPLHEVTNTFPPAVIGLPPPRAKDDVASSAWSFVHASLLPAGGEATASHLFREGSKLGMRAVAGAASSSSPFAFVEMGSEEAYRSEGSLSTSPAASISLDVNPNDGNPRSGTSSPTPTLSRSATPTFTEPGRSRSQAVSLSGTRATSRKSRKSAKSNKSAKRRTQNANQREKQTNDMWNLFLKRVVSSTESESTEAAVGVSQAAFAVFLMCGVSPAYDVLRAVKQGTPIPSSLLTQRSSNPAHSRSGSSIWPSGRFNRFNKSAAASSSSAIRRLPAQEQEFRLLSTGFGGVLPLCLRAQAPTYQRRLLELVQQGFSAHLAADIGIRELAYPYRHRLAAKYAARFLEERGRGALHALQTGLFEHLCARERENQQRKESEADADGNGTLRTTLTTFGAYLVDLEDGDDNPFASGRAAPTAPTPHSPSTLPSRTPEGVALPATRGDALSTDQQRSFWLARLSLGDEGFAVGSVPYYGPQKSGARYARWDATRLVSALSEICTSYSATQETTRRGQSTKAADVAQSAILRAVFCEHPISVPSFSAEEEDDLTTSCGGADSNATDSGDEQSEMSSTTAFSSDSEPGATIEMGFSAFPEPKFLGQRDEGEETITSDTCTSGSTYVYNSDGELMDDSPTEEEETSTTSAETDPNSSSASSHSISSSRRSRDAASLADPIVCVPSRRDAGQATTLGELEACEHTYLAGLKRIRREVLLERRRLWKEKASTMRELHRRRRFALTGIPILPEETSSPRSPRRQKGLMITVGERTFAHRTKFAISLTLRIRRQTEFARAALCLRLLAHDVLTLSVNRDEKEIARLQSLNGTAPLAASFTKPSACATDAIASAALLLAENRGRNDAAKEGPAPSIVDGLDYYQDHPVAAASAAPASDVAAYPPEMNGELLLSKLPTVNDLSRVMLANTTPKQATRSNNRPLSPEEDVLWDLDEFLEALQQVVMIRFVAPSQRVQ